jgi:hypothetical protein
MVHLNRNVVPPRVKTLPRFVAADLWREENIGLESSDGVYRLLPRALFAYWRGQKPPEARLPELSHRSEPRPRRVDFLKRS